MAKAYIHEIGDKLSSGATASNLPTHIKEIAPIMYNDGSNNFNSIQSALNGKAASSHNHDSRYYTESEVDTKLNGKAASSHNHGYITSDGKMDNPDNMTCPLVVSADGTIRRVYFGSQANTVAEGNHTHGLTFSKSSGTPDYTLKEGDIISVSAGGTTKKVQIAPDFVNTFDDPFIPPDVSGSIWRNADTGDLWIANGVSSTSNWVKINQYVPKTAYLIQKAREEYYPSSTSWPAIGYLCDGNATTTCTIKWPSDVITKNLTFSSSRGTVTFTQKGVYHIAVNIPLEITAIAPDTHSMTNFVFAFLSVRKTGSSDTGGYAYKRGIINRRLAELNTYFLNLDFDAVVNDDNAEMTGEVQFHGLNLSGSDGCEITVHQPTASISRVADV